MSDWCTIESDPGVFTELIKNIGVKGVQVEEIIDFDQLMECENTYGLIFLFKYIRNSGYNPKILNDYDEDLYFPKQVIVNACATQALIGILLNNEDKLEIGHDLTEFKSFTKLMDPYMKGLSISNCEKIRLEHNKFAKPEPFIFTSTRKATEEDDVYHYVSYVWFKGNIYEIDGLREGPILITENVSYSDWVNKVKPAILDRINLYANNEIKFNLLALVPDKRTKLMEHRQDHLKRKAYISRLLGDEDKSGTEDKEMLDNYPEYDKLTPDELHSRLFQLEDFITHIDSTIADEDAKFKRYKVENERRQHNYIPLIFELLKNMAEKNILEDIYNQAKDEEAKKK